MLWLVQLSLVKTALILKVIMRSMKSSAVAPLPMKVLLRPSRCSACRPVQSPGPWAHYITNALKAKELFVKDVNYIVRDGEAVIVDEFTGRVMPGRRWSDGQHQAIEAKEALQIQAETQTLASITYQNFFLLYPRLAGMTGTAKTEEVEFEKTYKLETTIVPTNRVRARQDWADQVYKTETAKWRAVANETAEIHKNGRPVLVGTTSVEKSELLSSLLVEQEIPHNLLNAKPENVERESEIVAQAGRAGAVTIATNMAGRGTDIILGGNSDYMARLKLREVLLGRLVKPEDDHKSPLPSAAQCKRSWVRRCFCFSKAP